MFIKWKSTADNFLERMMAVKFIHTADLHLDSPFEGLKSIPDNFAKRLYSASMTAFAEIVEAAIKRQVDFVLIAGDLYDSPHPSVAAQLFLQKEFLKLQQSEIPVYLCLGNHDFLNLENTTLVYPENVYVFPNQVTTKRFFVDGQSVSLTSFSYGKQWVEGQIDGFPLKGSERWHLGMVHGEISTDYKNAKYAPFSLTQLKSKNYDYWALGHIHKREVLSSTPLIIYPGNIQGKSIKETGVKGYYFVTDKDNKLVADFCPVAGIQWIEIPLEFEENDTFEKLKNKIENKLVEIKQNFSSVQAFIVRISLKASSDLEPILKERIIKGVLLGQLQNDIQSDDNLFLYDVLLKNAQIQQNNFWDKEVESKAKELVFQRDNLYKLADNLVKYRFIDEHFIQSSITESIGNKAMTYLEEEMGGD